MMLAGFVSRCGATLRHGVTSHRVSGVVCRQINTDPYKGGSIESEGRPGHLFSLSEEESLFKDTVAKLAQDKIKPYVAQMDREARLHPEVLKALFESGVMGIEIPQSYGGLGGSFFTSVLAIEEIGKVCAGVGTTVDGQNTLIINTFRNWASEEQKQTYYPRLLKNEAGKFGLSEAGSGSDAFALKTTARREGEYWIINGSKMWITSSTLPGFFLVMANANPEKGYRGITCFIVERDAEGFEIGPPEEKQVIRASSACPLYFDNVKVHESAILGGVGNGYKMAISTLNEGRIAIAALMTGVAESSFRCATEYTFERQQFGRKIFSFQGMQHQIAHQRTQIEAARLLTYNAARLKEAGKPFLKEAAMAKYFATEAAVTVTSQAISWMGGVGISSQYPVEKNYRDVKVGVIYEGTSNIQLNTIAKCVEQENGF